MTAPREGLRVTSFAKMNRVLRVLGKTQGRVTTSWTRCCQTVDLTEEIEFFLEGEEGSGRGLADDRGRGSARGRQQSRSSGPPAPSREQFSGAGAAPAFTFLRKSPSAVGSGEAARTRRRRLRASRRSGNCSLRSRSPGPRRLPRLRRPLLPPRRPRPRPGPGETVTPLPDGPEEWVLLVFPPFSLSTTEVYGRLRARSLTGSPSATKVSGSDTGSGPERNDLERAAESLQGELRRVRSALAGAGARSARLSGSGSTVFGTFGTKEDAARAMTRSRGSKTRRRRGCRS